MDGDRDITGLLSAWQKGEPEAEDRLLSLIYPQLRKIAAGRLPPGHNNITLRTTDLVHEAYLKLLGQQSDWQNRSQFFAVTARLMRRIVIDFARRRCSEKRGSGEAHLTLEGVSELASVRMMDWIDLDKALQELTRIDPRAARVVELRFFAGMTVDEIAEGLGWGSASVGRRWRFARAWLKRRMVAPAPSPSTSP